MPFLVMSFKAGHPGSGFKNLGNPQHHHTHMIGQFGKFLVQPAALINKIPAQLAHWNYPQPGFVATATS